MKIVQLYLLIFQISKFILLNIKQKKSLFFRHFYFTTSHSLHRKFVEALSFFIIKKKERDRERELKKNYFSTKKSLRENNFITITNFKYIYQFANVIYFSLSLIIFEKNEIN